MGRIGWGAAGRWFERPSTALFIIAVVSAASFTSIAISTTLAAGAPLTGPLLDASDSYPLMWGLPGSGDGGVTTMTARFWVTATRR